MMGSGMARCLGRKGLMVRGFDVQSTALERLKSDGGQASKSPAEAGDGAQAAVIVALNADQADDVVAHRGADHVVDGLRIGARFAAQRHRLGRRSEVAAAREPGMPMLMSTQATQLFRATAAAGMLEQDDLAVARLIERLAGLS
jgi:3-hydroxyisobutyrate dehydrogenase-like beta-hydroxyacid dehydrogenase